MKPTKWTTAPEGRWVHNPDKPMTYRWQPGHWRPRTTEGKGWIFVPDEPEGGTHSPEAGVRRRMAEA